MDKQESEQSYQQLIEYNPQAIAIHLEGHIIYVNAAAVELAGANSKDDLIGKETVQFVISEDRKRLIDEVRRSRREGKYVETVQTRMITLKNKILDVHLLTVSML